MVDTSKSPHNLPSSLEQKSNSALDLWVTGLDIERLAVLFASPGFLGHVLRTLANYAQYPQPRQRPEDIETLLLISNALVLAHRRRP